MIIKNVLIFTEDKVFEPGVVTTKGDKIESVQLGNDIAVTDNGDVVDGEGAYLIPGMIDLHFHGCMGEDACDGTNNALKVLAEYEASIGVTTICPATMTLAVEELEHVLETGATFAQNQKNAQGLQADLVGYNMEGPFISKAKKGAQNADYILPCDETLVDRFIKASNGLVKYVGIAPEESPNSVEFIKAIKDKVQISLAHTNASYEDAKAAFEAGATHGVHMYNAMTGLTHREPGVVGAIMDSDHVMAELICDGIHVHPAVVRTTIKTLGEDRVVFISDSMRAAGMKDGQYTLGGLDVNVKGKKATLVSDGAIAGSVTPLPDCVRTAVKEMGVLLETAIGCATMNPAKSLGIYEERGSIAPGKKADMVLWNRNLDLINVMKNGKMY